MNSLFWKYDKGKCDFFVKKVKLTEVLRKER